MHVAQRFELFLDKYRRPDGSCWTGQLIDEVTDGVVTRSYVTNLRKGRLENPGYEKMRAMARAMGFPPEAWFEDISADGLRTARKEERGVAGRVEHLFGAVLHPRSGEPYTSAEVARMSAGGLTEEEVEGDKEREGLRPHGGPGGCYHGRLRSRALLPGRPQGAATFGRGAPCGPY